MAFKMKGSPMARNFGIGKSAMKHADAGDPNGHKANFHTHGDVTHNTAGKVVDGPEGEVVSETKHDMKHSYAEGTPEKHTHGDYAVGVNTTSEERKAISRRRAADDPEGYGKKVWPGTNLSKEHFNEDGTKKEKSATKKKGSALKGHVARKHAHGDTIYDKNGVKQITGEDGVTRTPRQDAAKTGGYGS